ncbi:Uncharacterised protein [uncultured archaeon]|nr:Uncharacterised protein [uncultured archaeon]
MVNENEHIGTIVKNLSPLHDLEYKVVFSMHENTFFQKLVSTEVIDRTRVKPIEYFKSLMFLEYFTKVVEPGYTVCDNLETISKKLRESEREKGEDKGEKGSSYLNLETVVFETGLFAKEALVKSGKKALTKKQESEIRKRYDLERPVDLSSPNLRKLDPFYEAIGEMVASQLNDKSKPYLLGVKSRSDLGALVFSDSILGCIDDNATCTRVYSALANNNYYEASLIALKSLIYESSISKIQSAIEKNAK